MTNYTSLEQLRSMTTVVADTGDIEAISAYNPMDATTNPSLLLAASMMEKYQDLVKDSVAFGNKNGSNRKEKQAKTLDKLAVNFGVRILESVPRYISTEVDARLSFDIEGTIRRAKDIISLYQQEGIHQERVLIKIAATWEGIQAATYLEGEGIHCNMTLIFDFWQAAACAQADVFLISPFVGRILDWYQQKEQKKYVPSKDPGVQSVQRIYRYYKHYGYKTLIMGASFRNTQQIKALAGCDLLTISPAFLEELCNEKDMISQALSVEKAKEQCCDQNDIINESSFRWLLNENAMATEKLAEGIRRFASDTVQLEHYIKRLL